MTKLARAALTGVVITLTAAACATTSGDAVNARSYQCNDLKQLVAERQQVVLTGFLGTSSSVYASADSCDTILEKSFPSAWRTSDVFSCVVGYRCEEIIGKESSFGGSAR